MGPDKNVTVSPEPKTGEQHTHMGAEPGKKGDWQMEENMQTSRGGRKAKGTEKLYRRGYRKRLGRRESHLKKKQ